MTAKILGYKVLGEDGFLSDASAAWGTCWKTIGNWGGQLDSPFDINPKGQGGRHGTNLLVDVTSESTAPADLEAQKQAALRALETELADQRAKSTRTADYKTAFKTVLLVGHNHKATVDAMVELIQRENNVPAANVPALRSQVEANLRELIERNEIPAAEPDTSSTVTPESQLPSGREELTTDTDAEYTQALTLAPERSIAFGGVIFLSFIVQALPAIFMNTVGSLFLNSWWTIKIHTARMARNQLFYDWNFTELALLARNKEREAAQRRAELERQVAEPVTPDNRHIGRIGILGLPGLIVTWTAVAITLSISAFLRENWRSCRNQFARAALTIFDYQVKLRKVDMDNPNSPKLPVADGEYKDLNYDNPGFIEHAMVDKVIVRTWPRWGTGVFGLIPAAVAIVFTAVIAGTVFETYRSARLTANYFKSWWLEENVEVPRSGRVIVSHAKAEEYKNYPRDKARTWKRHAWGVLGYVVFSPFVVAGIGIATIYQESKKSWIEAANMFKGWFWNYMLGVQPRLADTLTSLADIAREATSEIRHPGRRYGAGGLGWVLSALTAFPVLLVAGILKQSMCSFISVFWWLAETVFQNKRLYTDVYGRKDKYSDKRLVFPQKVPLGLLGYIASIAMFPFAFVVSLGREGWISAVNVFTKFDSLMGTRRRSANELAELVQLRDRLNGELRRVNEEIGRLSAAEQDQDVDQVDNDTLNNNKHYLTDRIAQLDPKIAALEATIPAEQRRAPVASSTLLPTVSGAALPKTVDVLRQLFEKKGKESEEIRRQYQALEVRIKEAQRSSAVPASGPTTAQLSVEEVPVVPAELATQQEQLLQRFEAVNAERERIRTAYEHATALAQLTTQNRELQQRLTALQAQPAQPVAPLPSGEPVLEPIDSPEKQITTLTRELTELATEIQQKQRELDDACLPTVESLPGAANDPAMSTTPGWSNRAAGTEGWIREAMGCIGFALSSIVSVVGLSLYWFGRENVRMYGAHWRYFDGLLVKDHEYVPLSEHTNQNYSKWYHYAGGAPLAAVWWVTAVLALPVALATYYTTWPFLQMNAFAFKQNFKNLWNKATVDNYKWTKSPYYRPSPWDGTKPALDVYGQSRGYDEYAHYGFAVRRYYVMGCIGAVLGLAFGAVAWLGALVVRESYRSARYGIGAAFDLLYEKGFALKNITTKGLDEEENELPRGEATRSKKRVAVGFIPGLIATIVSIPFIVIGGAIVSFWHGAKGKIADHEGKYKIGQGPVSIWGGTALGTILPVVGNIFGYIGLRNLVTPSFWRTVFSYGPKNPLHVGVTLVLGALLSPITAVVLGATKLFQAIFGLGLFPRKPGVETLQKKYDKEKAKQDAARNPEPDPFAASVEPVVPLATEPTTPLATAQQFARIREDIALIESVFKDAYAATNWLGKLPRITAIQQGPVGALLVAEENIDSSPAEAAKPADSFTPAGIMSQIAAAFRQVFTFALSFNDERSIRVDLEAFRKLYMAEGTRADFNPYRFFTDRQDNSERTVILDGKVVPKDAAAGKDPQSLMNDAVRARSEKQHGAGFFARRYPVADAASRQEPVASNDAREQRTTLQTL